MSMKVNASPVIWMDTPDAFHIASPAIEQTFQPVLTAARQPGMAVLTKLLMETPLNDMASC